MPVLIAFVIFAIVVFAVFCVKWAWEAIQDVRPDSTFYTEKEQLVRLGIQEDADALGSMADEEFDRVLVKEFPEFNDDPGAGV